MTAALGDRSPDDPSFSLKSDRRGFLRFLAGVLALASGGASGERAQEGALAVHRATRNTRFGALGVRMPTLRRPPARFKSYPGRDRIELPPVPHASGLSLADAVARAAAGTLGFERKPISREQLARTLYLANGVTGRVERRGSTVHLRSAPSAGARYAGEVYAVAERVRGIVPGLYYYSVVQHRLVALKEGSWLDRAAGATAAPASIEDAAAVIVLTNVFARYSWRYANRGYRYALIDSGHIGENLRLAAASQGLAGIAAPAFEDDVLNSLLEVDGRREAVCALHAVGYPMASPGPAAVAQRSLVEKGEGAGQPSRSERSAPERFHEATKLVSGPPAAQVEAPALPENPATGPRSSLPTLSAPPPTALEATVRQRRSAKRFRDAPLRLEELAFALELAWGGRRPGSGTELFLVAHRVDGISPGLYQHLPAERQLVLLRAEDLRQAMIRACLGQAMAGAAAVGFLMVGRLLEAARRRGDRSYRDQLIESGEIGQRIYLAAEAQGLAARNLSAFVDDDFNRLLGFDGRQRAVLHLTMFGPGE